MATNNNRTPTRYRRDWTRRKKNAIGLAFCQVGFEADLAKIAEFLANAEFQFGGDDTRPVMPSRQAPYKELLQLLNQNDDVPAYIAESARLIYPDEEFPRQMLGKLREAGWDPHKITDPRLGTGDRRLEGRQGDLSRVFDSDRNLNIHWRMGGNSFGPSSHRHDSQGCQRLLPGRQLQHTEETVLNRAPTESTVLRPLTEDNLPQPRPHLLASRTNERGLRSDTQEESRHWGRRAHSVHVTLPARSPRLKTPRLPNISQASPQVPSPKTIERVPSLGGEAKSEHGGAGPLSYIPPVAVPQVPSLRVGKEMNLGFQSEQNVTGLPRRAPRSGRFAQQQGQQQTAASVSLRMHPQVSEEAPVKPSIEYDKDISAPTSQVRTKLPRSGRHNPSNKSIRRGSALLDLRAHLRKTFTGRIEKPKLKTNHQDHPQGNIENLEIANEIPSIRITAATMSASITNAEQPVAIAVGAANIIKVKGKVSNKVEAMVKMEEGEAVEPKKHLFQAACNKNLDWVRKVCGSI